MNITEATTAAGWIVGLAIVALIATGWRRTARATADLPLDPPTPLPAPAPDQTPAHRPIVAAPVAELHAPLDPPTSWLRRLWSVAAGSALAIWIGAALATIIGFGMAILVVTLTEMLKR